jgi:hypothetical protein
MEGQQKHGALGSLFKSTILRRIDSATLNVYQINDRFQNTPDLIDSLNVDFGDEFKTRPGGADNILSLTDTMTIDMYGEMRKLRHLTIMNPIVGFDYETIQGLGEFYRASGGEGSPSYKILSGCIINGDTLGTLLRTSAPGLHVNLKEFFFNDTIKSQMLIMSNPSEGLTIIDTVFVNHTAAFYSHPGYRSGDYGYNSFANGPFYIFPHDSIWLEIFIRDNLIGDNFTDTLRIYAHGINGATLPSMLLPIHVDDVSVHSDKNQNPLIFSCRQNYPNPFNARTTIEFTVPAEMNVSVKIYNMLGIEIKELLNKKLKAGACKIQFDAQDLPSGIYFYQVRAGTLRIVKKCILIK